MAARAANESIDRDRLIRDEIEFQSADALARQLEVERRQRAKVEGRDLIATGVVLGLTFGAVHALQRALKPARKKTSRKRSKKR